jgi:hypothetical protein
MRTDDLIHALVADNRANEMSIERRLAIAVMIGFALSAALFLTTLGPRPDIAAALTTPRFVLKIVETLLFAATAALLLTRLARPGAETRGPALAMLAAPSLLAAAIIVELVLVNPVEWSMKLVGTNSLICLAAVPLLSLPLLAAALYAVAAGAPTRRALAGAAVGLLAGGLAAALYATHCPDDSPLFVATWYSVAIAVVSLVGAGAGHYLLRW